MKTEIKAGTKVRLRKKLVTGKEYDKFELLSTMKFDGFEVVDYVSSAGNFFVSGFYYPRKMLTTIPL